MKTITVNVSEPVYEEFQRAAKTQGRPTSELIREAMERHRQEVLRPSSDLSEFRPVSTGRVLLPLTADDDILAEMIGDES